MRREWHVDMGNAKGSQGIHHRVHHGRRGADGSRFTDTFNSQRINRSRCFVLVRFKRGKSAARGKA